MDAFSQLLEGVATGLVGSAFAWWYALVLVLVFVVGALVLFGLFLRCRRRLKAGQEIVATRPDRVAFANEFEDVDSAMKRVPGLAHHWDEFTETFVYPAPDDKEREIRNCAPAADFFNDAAIVAPAVLLRFFSTLPNLLTGGGILGTFLGLFGGVTLANTNINVDDAKKTIEGIQGLLGGASLAFITSVVGIATGLAFLGVERLLVGRLRVYLGNFVRALDERLRLLTPAAVAEKQLRETREQTAQLQRFNNELIFSLEQALEEKVATRLSADLQSLIEAVNGLRADRSESEASMLQGIATDFQRALTESSGTQFNALNETLGTVNESIRRNAEAMARAQEGLQGSVGVIAHVVDDSMRRASTALDESLGRSLTGLVERVAQSGDLLTKALDESIRAAGSALESSSSAVGARAREVSAEISASGAQMAESLRAAGKDAEERIAAAADRFTRSVATLDGLLDGARGLLGGFNTASERMERLSASSAEIHGRVQTTLGAFERAAKAVNEGGSAAERSAARMEETARLLTGSVGELRVSQERAEASWRDYAERFTQVDGALRAAFEEMHGGLQEYVNKVDEFNAKLTGALDKALKNLQGAIAEMSEAIEDLGERTGPRR